jgi:hypothetical protein
LVRTPVPPRHVRSLGRRNRQRRFLERLPGWTRSPTSCDPRRGA